MLVGSQVPGVHVHVSRARSRSSAELAEHADHADQEQLGRDSGTTPITLKSEPQVFDRALIDVEPLVVEHAQPYRPRLSLVAQFVDVDEHVARGTWHVARARTTLTDQHWR